MEDAALPPHPPAGAGLAVSPQERVRAVLKSKAGTSAKIVLIAIADRMIDTRLWAWCGPGDIQKRTSLGERQTRTLLGELMADGILTRETRDTEHGEREGYVIDWARLSAVEPAKTARGGKREPTAKTAGKAANIAGSGAETTGKDCRGVWQTLPGEAAKTAETTGKDCNRSGNEAVSEAVHEAEGEREGASLTTPPTSDPAGSVPPAELTSAMEGSYAPTTDPTPEHVNETDAGDRAEEGDVPRVASGSTVGLFGAKWAAALAPEPTPEPKPAPVETVKERNRRERAERAAALAAEVNTVWQSYAARHPTAGRRGPDGERLPSEADAARIAKAIGEWGAADVVLLLDWAHDAPDDQATWLQGKRGGTAYLGLANLLVADKAGGRMDIARQWHEAGRPSEMPTGVTAPPVRGGSRASQNASASLAVLAKMMEAARAK